MEKKYLISGKEYMDTYLIREQLDLKKYELQHLFKIYDFPVEETFNLQNKKLYSIEGISDYIEMILDKHGR